MKLRRRKTRTVGKKPYFKWVLHPPGHLVEQLGWEDKEELEASVERGALVIRRAKGGKP